jgi:hypothetical protein
MSTVPLSVIGGSLADLILRAWVISGYRRNYYGSFDLPLPREYVAELKQEVLTSLLSQAATSPWAKNSKFDVSISWEEGSSYRISLLRFSIE